MNNINKQEKQKLEATIKALSNELQLPRTPVSVTIADLIKFTVDNKEPISDIARGARNPFEDKGKCEIL